MARGCVMYVLQRRRTTASSLLIQFSLIIVGGSAHFLQQLFGFALRERADANISKRDGVVVSLETQGPWAIRSFAGSARPHRTHVHIFEHFLSILDDVQTFAYVGDIEGLPFAGRL